ncbi:MAG TPA: uracil-DNA glycosylase family protein [Nocardioidaceae bacterium]|nr:uracil-DNA glycosylase family protein [Nocardioidaceae bacterium]
MFDVGYDVEPFRQLCENAPTSSVYPVDRFRVEWGPIFHRGRLDGTARVLVIGQDPAAHEAVARRILCGVAGHRVQGFLAKLGIDRSYVMINAFLYSLFGTDAPTHTQDQLDDRFDWIEAILETGAVEVVVTFGAVANKVWARYLQNRPPATPVTQVAAVHPTAHLSDAQLLDNWNAALDRAHAAISFPDQNLPLIHYADDWDDSVDLVAIPGFDLPAGLPAWMAGAQTWAVRGDDRAPVPTASRITTTIPESDRIDR